jgi:hypothetical protein
MQPLETLEFIVEDGRVYMCVADRGSAVEVTQNYGIALTEDNVKALHTWLDNWLKRRRDV